MNPTTLEKRLAVQKLIRVLDNHRIAPQIVEHKFFRWTFLLKPLCKEFELKCIPGVYSHGARRCIK